MAGLLRRIRLIPVCRLAGILLSACGEEQISYTKQGMAAVEALEYNEALNCFKNGQEQGEDERLIYRGMGLAYMGLTQYEDAIIYLEEALHEDIL